MKLFHFNFSFSFSFLFSLLCRLFFGIPPTRFPTSKRQFGDGCGRFLLMLLSILSKHHIIRIIHSIKNNRSSPILIAILMVSTGTWYVCKPKASWHTHSTLTSVLVPQPTQLSKRPCSHVPPKCSNRHT